MRFIRKYFATITALLLLAVTGWAWLNRLAIYDWFRLRDYTPPAVIVQLATDTTMKDSARNLFYVQHPSIEGKTTFNEHCPRGEQTIVLGCYVSKVGIYIYDVTDARLEGIEQVTAAHELLHAAYERLSKANKDKIGASLKATYQTLGNARITETIEQYQVAGADITNELHSILATEVRNLPPELETYYQRYFTDRSAIVGFSEQYEQAFVALKNQVEAYDQELEALKAQIDANEQNLTAQGAAIEADRARLDSLLAANQVGAYNAAIPAFNAKVRAYNALVNQTKDLINQYNAKLEARNALALEEQALFKAIDSRLSTEETQ
ncbi:MAG: hypothetical protein KIH63_000620 [Candidatus Saccharibacteria bacterium]|nr:hypothetical protein [Candidatus Saccharibacteria bacterium]